jgi:DNA-binding transcriptional MerR regulator
MGNNKSLAELAETSGLPARTIRFYIARGLIGGPVKSGRDACYTGEHLARLERIKRLQAEGKTLVDIGRILSGARAERVIAPAAWLQYRLHEDVSVWVRAGTSPWRSKQIAAALQEFAARVAAPDNTHDRKNPT